MSRTGAQETQSRVKLISPTKDSARRWVFPPGGWFFLGKLLAWYLGLLVLWLPLGSLYRRALIAAGNAVFSSMGENKAVLFMNHADWRNVGVTERVDLAILIRRDGWRDKDGREQHILAKAVSTFYQPFTALCFLLALFLATSLPWKKRALKIASAVLVLHGLMLICVGIDVAHAFGTYGGSPRDSTSWASVAINVLHSSVTDWPAGVFIVPLLLWLGHCRGGLSPDFFRPDAGLSRGGEKVVE